jgi:hypothetical protein
MTLLLVTPTTGPGLRADALEALNKIDQAFWNPKTNLYREYADTDQPAFNWTVGVTLSALNLAAANSPKWKARIKAYLPPMDAYWNEIGPVPGYDVLPGPKPVDRYYDDNAWMVMALVDTARTLKDNSPLVRARQALRFAFSGIDGKLGGGSYWKEVGKDSKNTCSNAPTAAAAIALWRMDRNPELLTTAKALYDWTNQNLRDPADSLMWDAMDMNGKVEKTKWSYNTALMLRCSVELAKITGDPKYSRDAESFAKAATSHWIDFPKGTVRCEAKFAHLLIENLADYRRWKSKPLTDLQALMSTLVGRQQVSFPSRWDKQTPRERPELIDQMSIIRAALVVSDSVD